MTAAEHLNIIESAVLALHRNALSSMLFYSPGCYTDLLKAGLGFDVSSVSSVETNGAVLLLQLDSVQYVIICLERYQKTDLYHPALLANSSLGTMHTRLI